MKTVLYTLIAGLCCTSCLMTNRMTSPVALEKEQRTWSYGTVISPTEATQASWAFAFNPTVSYRSGLGNGNELGVSLYGIFLPGLVFDYKHEMVRKNNFTLSGDLALIGPPIRSTGLQYDLLFGNELLYGVAGYSAFITDHFGTVYQHAVLGIGFGSQEGPGGVQIVFTIPTANYEKSTVGIGIELGNRKRKKKYRE